MQMTLPSVDHAQTFSTPRTVLPRSGLNVSRLGLGLAHLHTLSNARERRNLIHAAIDLGITHFDTARLYSDGLSESGLGAALKGRRHQFTIATKFGLLPHTLIGAAGIAAMPLRKARSLFTKLGLMHYPVRAYDLNTLRSSLHASLKALQTDHIDIYFMHEPAEGYSLSEEVFQELERYKQQGLIRHIGVSGATNDAMVEHYENRLDVLQNAESSWSPERYVPDITHSLFSSMNRAKGASLAEADIERALKAAIARRPRGAFIVQTRHAAHLKKLARWSEDAATNDRTPQ